MSLSRTSWTRWLRWLAVAGWMVAIFLFSAQVADKSNNTSGTMLQWILDLLFREFDSFSLERQAMIRSVWTTIIRKGAHFTEYAVLAMLLANALGCYSIPVKAKWLLPVLISALYAVTDEVHQYFVPGRACRLLDVGIDTCGAIFGMVVYTIVIFIWQRIKAKNTAP